MLFGTASLIRKNASASSSSGDQIAGPGPSQVVSLSRSAVNYGLDPHPWLFLLRAKILICSPRDLSAKKSVRWSPLSATGAAVSANLGLQPWTKEASSNSSPP